MTVEQAGEIEYAELVERTRREAETKAPRRRGRRAHPRSATSELAKARSWDEFKDDNPFGHGNSKLRPCS